ncbi:MAG: AAA family ATPase [Chitinivibrionales bacterium]|nr:AAA family ATPase [Chitinivibrionales bacterium]
MNRIYENYLKKHFCDEQQMILLSGPRQVGKTTSSRDALPGSKYLNWDVPEDRTSILKGPKHLYETLGLNVLSEKKACIVFDEIHKFPKWKNFLKGFYDLYGKKLSICVTGSARLSAYRYGGDSLMGRYFPLRMHPLSVREVVFPELPDTVIVNPVTIPDTTYNNLFEFGGFPDPYIKSNKRFYNRWRRLRLELLFKEDLRDLTHISDAARVRTLADMLTDRAGSQINYSHLAHDLQVSVDTVRRWIDTLEEMYYCFRIRPYSKKIARSLLREPKIYLWDWSLVKDPGARFENFAASHLLKYVHYLTDTGFGSFELHYLRDKQKREVDFAVIRDDIPWFVAEAKISRQSISPSLHYFKEILQCPNAFQITKNIPYVNKDCFKETGPVIVPDKTFFSQLV